MIDSLGPLAGPLAGLAWGALLLPHLARYNRERRANRKARTMTAPIVTHHGRRPHPVNNFAEGIDTASAIAAIHAVMPVQGDLWDRVAEGTPSGKAEELRIRSAHIGRGPLAVELVGTEPLRTAGRLAA